MIDVLTKLRKDAPRKLTDLKTSCDELLVQLADSSQEIDNQKYFDPLAIACESRQSKLVQTALDAIHFLIGKPEIFLRFFQSFTRLPRSTTISGARVLDREKCELFGPCDQDGHEVLRHP
jgi:hypothetical protein